MGSGNIHNKEGKIGYRKLIVRVLLFVYIGTIFYLFLADSDNFSSFPQVSFLGIPADKLFHFLAYTPFVILLYFSFSLPRLKARFCYGIPFVLIVGAVICTITEILQLTNPTRSFSMYDLAANYLGLLTGAIFVLYYVRTRRLQ